jgi:diadenylate cyclase
MQLHDLSSFNFTFFDVLDVLIVAIIIYQLYNLIRGTIAANIFIGLAIICLMYYAVRALQMHLLTAILDKFMEVGILALIVVFQQEIRRFLLLVGKNASLQRNKAWWRYFFGKNENEKNNLARIKRLLESIFQKTSPLHDGAVVIAENKIKAASCILPLTDNTDLPPQFGLRHRAGIGVSEANDATAIIISEETGELSYAKHGRVKMNIGFAEVETLLNTDF